MKRKNEWGLDGSRSRWRRIRDTLWGMGKWIGILAGVTITTPASWGPPTVFGQEIPATDGNQNPGDRLPGGGVDWSYLSGELNPDRVQVQLGDAGGVIFTQPGIRNRGPTPIVPRVPWATGNTGPTTALAGRPFKTPMGVRVIGGYTILPTSPGVARVNAGFAGIPAPTDSRPIPDRYPDRFEQMRAEQLRLRAIRQAAGSAGIDRAGSSGQPSGNAVHSNESFHEHPVYAETSLRNRLPMASYSPQVRTYSNRSSTRVAAIPTADSQSTDREVLWMRDQRLPNTTEETTEGFDGSMDSISDTSQAAWNGDDTENTWSLDSSNNMSNIDGTGSVENGRNVLQMGNVEDSFAQTDPAVAIAQRITWASGIQRLTPMHVYVSGSTVTLQGVVQSAVDRELAGAIAREQPGIRSVRNELRVAR